MQRMRLAPWMCPVVFGIAGILAVDARAAESQAQGATLAAAGAAVTVDAATGRVTSIRLNDAEEMATPHPAGSETPFGYLEVIDLRDHRTYNPLVAGSKVTDWRVAGAGQAMELSFTQRYDGAPFTIVQTFRRTDAGLRWEARLRLLDDQKDNRSVVVSWVLPLPVFWKFWGPSNLDVHTTNGNEPYRYIYGHTDPSPMSTVIPLVGAWGKKAGAAIFSPPDVRKSQVIFEVHTQGLSDAGACVLRHVEDLQSLRASYHQVGLRPGKDLVLAVGIAATRPDWRGRPGRRRTRT